MTAKTHFVREATGIVRSFGMFDTFWLISLGLAGNGLSSLAFFLGYWTFLAPNGDIPSQAILGIIAGLVAYWPLMLLTVAMPRTGGDYLFVSRIIHPALGFMNNFVFTIGAIIGIGISLPYLVFSSFAAPAYFLSLETGNQALFGLATSFSQPTYAFLLGTVYMLILTAIMLVGAKAIKILNRLTFLLMAVGILMIAWVGLTYSQPDFMNAFNALAPQTGVTYKKLIETAQQNGWNPPQFTSLGAVPGVMVSALITFYGLGYSYYGSEIKEVSRNLPIATLLAAISGGAYFALTGLMFYKVFGVNFYGALSWLSFGPGAGSNPFPITPAHTAVLFILAPGLELVLGAIIAVTWTMWFVGFFMMATRGMFAWSFDRIMPEAISRVSPRFHTPVAAVIIVFVLAEIFQYLFIFTGLFTTQFNFFLFLTSVLILPSICTVVFPFLKKTKPHFEAAPSIVKTKIAGVPLMSVLGIGGTYISIWTMWMYLQIPTMGPLNPAALGLFVGSFVAGLAIYYIAKVWRSRQGIDVGLAFKEIPPE